ncbi:aconitate hydratase [Prosthecobacter dejongeii]|uniref:Aconitate hydratase A n=1 Tax=Prosthecobacter dejongeii TaxID=48465 RepID=A0A7W8DR83_9BACT|nr:aconitate hydratase [Prosthecobacter dejongeii]MBB5038990.1 aconitate hydratase [Prosthecobacter dejongeii]
MNTLSTFTTGTGSTGKYHSLPELEKQGVGPVSKLPISIRIVLESLLRNLDGKKVTVKDVTNLANWNAKNPGDYEIPFTVARIVLQDFTGVPLLVDLAAMRSAVAKMGKNTKMIEPLVPVDLVVDHSVQVDFAGTQAALNQNLALEFERNRERYEFLKWGEQAFDTFKVVPPGIGIVHQVNLEYLAKGVLEKDGVFYPDTLVGTDSHTTMINGLGVVAWGVGGIEAEAGMLGQPVTFLVPEVVGVYLTGSLREGVTATDLALHCTQMLRKHGVVGKFVEFYGPGAESLPLPDRATIANMAPEYGATMGFFPVDEECVNYLRGTGRSEELCTTFKNYYTAQGMFGIPKKGEVEFTSELTLDLGDIQPSVAGPKRPQDRITVEALKSTWNDILTKPTPQGYGKTPELAVGEAPEVPATLDSIPDNKDSVSSAFGAQEGVVTESSDQAAYPLYEVSVDSKGGEKDVITHGSVLIAAITSCTNTSNPSVMLAAGLLAQKANAKGLTVKPAVKTSLGPGSRVVTDYLNKTGLQVELDKLGFQTVGYGCTTCIGNSGPLDAGIEDVVKAEDIVAASVLSGNRNFEARVHQSIKANFLMSPPLVVAYAIAGTVDIDLSKDEIVPGTGIYLKDIWPSLQEIQDALKSALSPDVFRALYTDFASQNPKWNEIPASTGLVYGWDEKSTYIQHPPFFEDFSMDPNDIHEIVNARPLGIFGDSVTTDHISPAGAIKKTSPAGRFLGENGVAQSDFNSYGSRRGNDRVMTRGTFANVRIKNLMLGGKEGGDTLLQPAGTEMSIYDAAIAYMAAGTPSIIIGGEDYGMGSSRDWAAKGTRLLGVKAVITKSFERIHRSNLVGMGVLPCNFKDKADYDKVKDLADATFSILGISNETKPQSEATLRVTKADGSSFDIPLVVRIDTPVEIDYYRAGGILPYVLAQILRANT